MSAEEKNAVIRRDPRYDIDAVKRRTRGGMGRCQGGFCSPEVVRILAREWCIPFDAVTKCGNGSYINKGRTKTTAVSGQLTDKEGV